MNVPFFTALTDLLFPVEVGDLLAPEPDLELTAGATVQATAVRHIVRRVGTDKYGDVVYRTQRTEYTVIGYVTSINLEDEATVRYYDEHTERWQTGTWVAGELAVIYPATQNAAA